MNIDAKTALSLVDAYCDGLIKNSGTISDTLCREGWDSAVEAVKDHIRFIHRVHDDDTDAHEIVSRMDDLEKKS